MVAVCALSGCDETPIDPRDDAAIDLADAGMGDGATPPGSDGGAGECRSDVDCDDGNPCTDTFCEGGACWGSRVEGCFECATAADCDDGFRCSVESCVGGVCSVEWSSECDCLDDGDCDDANPATVDRCTSDYRCSNEARTCTGDADCDDGDACTSDACSGEVCVSTRIAGCGTSSCPDRDGDGHGSRWGCVSGGDDCDDANPAISPSATELCDDAIDNDCDGLVDYVDDDCSLGGETCATARALTPGTPLDGVIRTDGTGGTGTGVCGESSFYALSVPALSDVEVTVTLEDPPPPVADPFCPECTPDHEWEYWFNVFVETVCGDTTTDIGGAGSGCRVYGSDSFFGGSPTHTIRLRRVPAGTYTLEVQASDFFGWMASAIRYSIEATVTPSDAPACGTAGALTEGATVRGQTGSGTDAFGTDCDGDVVSAEEAIHTFTLTERRRVRLEAAGVPDPTSGAIPGLRVGLLGACDPSAPREDCLEHSGRDCHQRATLERVLDPGTYWAVVEGWSGGDRGYDLTLRTEAVGAACAGATVIGGSGSFSGDTTGAPDAFRDHRVCGDGYAPDHVYRVDVTAEARVVLDLIASYPDAMVTLYEGCGEARVAGGRGRTRVDLTLSPGTYYAVVGGENAADAGGYVLNATFVAVSP